MHLQLHTYYWHVTKKDWYFFAIISSILLLLTVIATFLSSKEDNFKNTVAGIGVVISIFTLYATNSYNRYVQKQSRYDEIRKQAEGEGAWISDTSNVPVISFINKNSSDLPIYNAYFFLVKDNNLRGLDSSRIRYYRTIAPGTTKGSFTYIVEMKKTSLSGRFLMYLRIPIITIGTGILTAD